MQAKTVPENVALAKDNSCSLRMTCCRDLLGSKGYRPSALVTGLCFDILKASRLGMALQGRLTHVTADQDG